MDNVIFVDFPNKQRVTEGMLPHLMGLLMTVHNASELIGRDFIYQQLKTLLSIKD